MDLLKLKPTCIQVPVLDPNRFWQTSNVLRWELPILAVQLTFTVIVSRLFFWVYKPLHQPHLIAHISAGFLLGYFYNQRTIFNFFYPASGILNIEVLSNFGLIYYAFMSGLEMNINTILNAQKKSASIAVAGILIPLVTGPLLYGIHRQAFEGYPLFPLEVNATTTSVLWTMVLTDTGFPVLAHTLSELKLLYTGLGKTALTAAMISDIYVWFLFIIFFPFAMNHGERAVYSVMSTLVFFGFCVFALRPIINHYIDRKTELDDWDDHAILYVVMGVVACSWITDFLGTHAIVGAFVYGLILPHGKFAEVMTSVSDDFGSAMLGTLYFCGTGMRLNLHTIVRHPDAFLILVVVAMLCLPKILSTVIASYFFGLRTRDGFALGLLLNTKGSIAFVMLNNAWDRKIISVGTYSVLASGVILMTVIVPPVINAIYKPRKRFEQSKLKTIQKLRSDAELRVLACVHNARNATSMVSVLDNFKPTRLSPLHVFAAHLVELTGRAAALVAAHVQRPTDMSAGGDQNLTRTQAELKSITNTFESFGETYDAVRVETLNIVSSYTSIHEDICNMANEKCTSLILLPFHKHITLEGSLEITNEVNKEINLHIMEGAPCSVGIFVDREQGGLSKMNFRITMIFVGGPDDREALAVAGRMGGHPGVSLAVVRFLLFDEAAEVDSSNHTEAQGILSAVIDNEVQKEMDEEYVSSFRLTQVNNDDTISYSEVDIRTAEDVPTVLNEVEQGGCDLYIVGQGLSRNSKVFLNLLEWCDCAELGVIGDILASNNFASRASVLVVQQYGYGGLSIEKPPNRSKPPANNNNNTTANNNDKFESLVVTSE